MNDVLKVNYPVLANAEERFANVDDRRVKYFYNELSSGGRPYGGQYIVLLDEEQPDDIFDAFMSKRESFALLQDALVWKDFCDVDDNFSFNLYLIFITEAIGKIKILRDMLKDLELCKKVVLSNDRARDYFDAYPLFKRGAAKVALNFRESEKMIKESVATHKLSYRKLLSSYIDNSLALSRLEEDSVFFPSNVKFDITDKIFEAMGDYLSVYYEQANAMPTESKDNTVRRGHIRKIKRSISKITKMTVEKVNNFKEVQPFDFGYANLLYGDNGAGKTTTINELKRAIVGCSEKNENTVIIGTYEDGAMWGGNDFDSSHPASSWYGLRDKNIHECFEHFNFFDGGRVFEKASHKEDIANLIIFEAIGGHELDELKDKLRSLVSTINDFDSALVGMAATYTEACEDSRDNSNEQPSNRASEVATVIEALSLIRNDAHALDKLIDADMQKIHGQITNSGLNNVIEKIYLYLTSWRDFSNLVFDPNGQILSASKSGSDKPVAIEHLSTGQKVCYALAVLIAKFVSNEHAAPNIIILDEPVANLDNTQMLNMLDVLRLLVINGTQIFFTTADERIAGLFRRKFAFLGDEFRGYMLSDEGDDVKVTALDAYFS